MALSGESGSVPAACTGTVRKIVFAGASEYQVETEASADQTDARRAKSITTQLVLSGLSRQASHSCGTHTWLVHTHAARARRDVN